VSFALVSRAPLATLQAYQKRMGWSLKWLSSLHTDFILDYQVTATPEELESKQAYYNSCYARGLDMPNGAFHLLDLVPKGRDEKGLSWRR
jgi:predicted dithiol-disulfide oxidoreductase (DUF899 family)